jgi:hypothetical protein
LDGDGLMSILRESLEQKMNTVSGATKTSTSHLELTILSDW